MARRRTRSISLPIALGSVAVGLAALVLAGWIYLLVRRLQRTQEFQWDVSLLVSGVVFLVAIITVLVLFSVFLVREIQEVRRQTSFIDSVTHELRSPLASIRLGLDTLARPQLDPDQRAQLREMMLDDVERLSAFIADILEANRLSHRQGPQRWEAVDLRPLVDQAVATVLRRRRIDTDMVNVDIAEGTRIHCDPTALEVVVKNLVDNALKYSGESPDVTIRLTKSSVRLELTVTDRGIGIPKTELRRVTERFYRVADEETQARHGTGLGLFVVSALVRDLRGKLLVESDGIGQGTTVRVSLPRRLLVEGAAA